MKNVLFVLREMWANRERIFRLAKYERKAKNADTSLGKIWDLLNPVFQIGVYWLVFGMGLRVQSDQAGIPYIVWMMTGMVPWFCVNSAMSGSAKVISGNANIIKNVSLPLSIVPAKEVVSCMIEHFWTVCFLLVMIFVSGIAPNLYMLQVVYYTFCMAVFLIAFSLFASSIGAVMKDFSGFLNPIIRLLFFVSDTISPNAAYPETLQTILKINPVTYITGGYRNALLYKIGIWETPWHALSFWTVTLVLLFLGSLLHMRTREKFADLL